LPFVFFIDTLYVQKDMKLKRPPSTQPIPASARRVFKGVIFDVYQWKQKCYDGKIKIFEKLKRADSAMVIPIMTDGKIILSKQEQPGKKPFIGLIGGRVDRGETPLTAAKRELLEETGLRAKKWSLFIANQPTSKIDWVVYCFIATGCEKISEQNLDGAEKIKLLPVDFDTFVEMATTEGFPETELRIKLLEAKLDPKKIKNYRKLFSSK